MTRRGPSRRSGSKTSCSPTWGQAVSGRRRPRAPYRRCADDSGLNLGASSGVQGMAALGLLAALAVVMLVTGLHLRDLYNSSGMIDRAKRTATARRSEKRASSLTRACFGNLLGPLLLAIPVITGIFWGAPLLAREPGERHLPARLDAERHPDTLASDQAHARRARQHRRRRALQPDGAVVVQPRSTKST